jgi:hypothetical protein
MLTFMRQINVRGAFTELMNARGVPGRLASKPFHMLTPGQTKTLYENSAVKKLLSGSNVPAS